MSKRCLNDDWLVMRQLLDGDWTVSGGCLHFPNTFQTSFISPPDVADIFQTPYKHLADMFQIPSQSFPDSFRNVPNTLQTHNLCNFQKPDRNFPDTFQTSNRHIKCTYHTPSRHLPDTSLLWCYYWRTKYSPVAEK